MKSITTSGELKAAIQQLELQQADDLILLKEQYFKTKEGFKLVNLIKSKFKEVAGDPDLKTDAINAAIGFTSGILARKLMIGKTINPFKKLLGIAVEMVVASKVVKNADGIKLAGGSIFNRLFRKKEVQDKSY
ncbi:MAG: hypothetical protein WAT20_03470 [Ferruginibacter sp.]|nr:hypothetical protein [Chitinophagaceae bacterium]